MNQKQITLHHHTYPIFVNAGSLHDFSLQPYICGHQILIVTQKNIAQHYLDILKNQLQNIQVDVVYLQEGEQYKNFSEWEKIFDALLKHEHERSTTLIALGGGVVGDMTGFAAACYQRGVNYIQIPTSLMAQVDSAIGGKTGINHALGKNMLGAFYHPQCVLIDVNLLRTLPQNEFISGLAEVIKYGLICDEKFFAWIENNVDVILNRDVDALLYLVKRSVTIKADIVMQDEKDLSLRKLLNFGHTFGHAIETALGYNILHGEAVAIGMLMAAKLSAELSEADVERISKLLDRCGLLQKINLVPALADLMPHMKRDKKVSNQKINFILLKKIGEAALVILSVSEGSFLINRSVREDPSA